MGRTAMNNNESIILKFRKTLFLSSLWHKNDFIFNSPSLQDFHRYCDQGTSKYKAQSSLLGWTLELKVMMTSDKSEYISMYGRSTEMAALVLLLMFVLWTPACVRVQKTVDSLKPAR